MATERLPARKRAAPLAAADARLLDECGLFDVHRLSRVMTVFYNAHLRDTDLTMATFTLMRNIAAIAPAGMTTIAEAMLMDRTSLTRLVEPLIKRGLLSIEAGKDRRVRNVIVTVEGHAAIARSEAAWLDAQRAFVDRIGADQWRQMRGVLRTTLHLLRSGDTDKGP